MSTRLVNLHRAQKQETFDSASGKSSPDVLSLDIPPLASASDSPKDSGSSPLLSIFKPSKVNLDDVATQPSVFDDPSTLEAYRPPPGYESAHRFDPDARWTWREEKVP